MAWVDSFYAGTVKPIEVVKILGGLGLVLPGLTGIAPVLTPLAATGLAVTGFVAWGRFGSWPL